MQRQHLLFGLTAVAALLLVAASIYAWTREDSDARAGSSATDQVERGRALFLSKGCVSCHDMRAAGIDSGFGVGPELSWIARDAGSRVEGQSADTYIRTSIVNPDAFVAPGGGGTFSMPQLELSPDELDAVVAFLLAESEHSFTIGVSS